MAPKQRAGAEGAPRPANPPPRNYEWSLRPAAGYFFPVGYVRLGVGQEAGEYFVRPISGGDLPARRYPFLLRKVSGGSDPEADSYVVVLSPGDCDHTCECRGFLRWQRCKHIEGLLCLLAELAAAPPQPDGAKPS